MTIRMRNRFMVIGFLFAFFVIGSIANVTWNEPLSFTGTMVFSALFIIWTSSVRSRIINRRLRRYFVFLGLLMLLWMVERAVKFCLFFNSVTLERYLWYAYYIPIIIMPLLSLMIALSLGKTDDERLSAKLRLLYIPAALLIVAVMSNDFHQQAFRFIAGLDNYETKTYAIVYYLVLLWIALCVFATLALTLRFSNTGAGKRRGLVPLTVILLSFAFVAVYIFTDFRHTRMLNVPELFCFSVAAYWEACLQTGLIPANTGYDALFKISHLHADIKDSNGNAVYRAVLQSAPEHYIEHENVISGGSITWLEDITTISEQKVQLEEANLELAKRAKLQKKENALKEERTRIIEQNRIYDKINASLKPQTALVRQLVKGAQTDPGSWQRSMSRVCIVGAFMKRKSNLMFLAAKSRLLPLAELHLSFCESLSYLERADVKTAAEAVPERLLPSEELLRAYDAFEAEIEQNLFKLESVGICYSEQGDKICVEVRVNGTPLLLELKGEEEE